MRGIDQFQQWSASAQLNLILVEQINRAGDALAIDERAVEAFQIDHRKLIVGATYLCVTARDDRGGRIDYHVAFRIATQSKYIFVQFKPPGFCRLRID